MTALFLLRSLHYSSTGPLVVNPAEWQKRAESVIASANIEDVRLAFYARLRERYGIRNGLISAATTEINLLQEPLQDLGVSLMEAQRLAALRHLEALQEELSWMGRYFQEHLDMSYRGPRPITRFIDKLLKATLLSALSRSDLGSTRGVSENAAAGVCFNQSSSCAPSMH
jgi:hypothetical protein